MPVVFLLLPPKSMVYEMNESGSAYIWWIFLIFTLQQSLMHLQLIS
uniref:Uncharacterized protein n=1 Tax=Anguilla anguilla TaxID=7936 RepID=A0A0E9W8I0_ANGAN